MSNPAPDLGKAFVLGLLLSAPIGPVALLTLQNAIERRPVLACAAGVGALSCDLVVLCAALAGADAVSYFLIRWAPFLGLTFGLLLTIGGVLCLRRPQSQPALALSNPVSLFWTWGQGVALAAANPANVAVVAVAAVGLRASAPDASLPTLALAFGLGGLTWWMGLALAAGRFERQLGHKGMRRVSVAISLCLIVFGAALAFGGVIGFFSAH